MTQALSLDNSAFEVADQLTEQSLGELASGSVAVIWHRQFYAIPACQEALPRIRSACEASSYTLTSDLQSLGTSIGEAAESPESEARYFATSLETTRQIRQDIFAPLQSPVDLIRLTFDELWPTGAMTGRVDNNPMLAGIVRRWKRGGQANPHIDQADIPILQPLQIERRIGVNVYVEVPRDGGSLTFWGRVIDEREYERTKRPDYGLDREVLGTPLLSISPDQGDLIAFDAARIHSVDAIVEGERVTCAAFIGVPTAANQPLVVFA